MAQFLEKTGGILQREAGGDEVVQVPGLVLGAGGHRQVGLGQALGDIEEGGGEHRSLKKILPLANGGDHEAPAGGMVFYFVEQAFHHVPTNSGVRRWRSSAA